MVCGGMLKQAIYSLDDGMKELGRELNINSIAEIVQEHAILTAASAAASGSIPGAGGVIALGIACTSTATMYGRLANAIGVRLNNGLIRALASAVTADLSAAIASNLVVSAALSFIPGVGTMAASALTAITNYGFIYLAGLIFIKMVVALGVTHMEHATEDDMKAAAKNAQSAINIKDAMKEAKNCYKKQS